MMNIITTCRKNGVNLLRGTDEELWTQTEPSHSIGSSKHSVMWLVGRVMSNVDNLQATSMERSREETAWLLILLLILLLNFSLGDTRNFPLWSSYDNGWNWFVFAIRLSFSISFSHGLPTISNDYYCLQYLRLTSSDSALFSLTDWKSIKATNDLIHTSISNKGACLSLPSIKIKKEQTFLSIYFIL